MSERSILFIAPAAAVTAIFPQLKEAGYEAGLAENLSGALKFIKKTNPSLIFSRTALPGYKIQELLAQAASDETFPEIVAFTDKGSPDEARKLLELGAKDYWLEPLEWEKIEAMIPAPRNRAASQKPQSLPKPSIIGDHPVVRRVLALAKQVARSKATVLISGESGTGKEMFARYVHDMSDRADKPFIAINCAALPEHLLESELFGHEKGAFTGAINRKPGKFELADGGTLLLDEISEMDPGLQAKLLRVLQEGELDRVGGLEPVKVDVRVLATTNRELEKWVEAGEFRQDLYFRLNVIPLRLPALRDRGDDVLLLARFFVDRYSKEYKLPHLEFSPDAVAWLTEFDWPGNVRELQNLMERAVLLAGPGPIDTTHFLLDIDSWTPPEETAPEQAGPPAAQTQASAARPAAGPSAENLLQGSVLPLHEMERIMIMRGLEETSGNRTQAAEILGISVRTLRNKLNEYRSQGLDVP